MFDHIVIGAGSADCADRHFIKARATDKAWATEWTHDPLFRGCCASAQPGATALRKVLAGPPEKRLFFTGEANDRASVGGAHLSGVKTARKVAGRLD